MKKEVKKGDILKRPEYPGGQKALKAFIAQNLTYPKEARQARLEGIVHVRYTIGHDGSVRDARILHGLGMGCDEEALRLVRLLRFSVEKTRGVRVQYPRKIQIHFRLPKPAQNAETVQVQYQVTSSRPAEKQPAPPSSTRSYVITIPLK